MLMSGRRKLRKHWNNALSTQLLSTSAPLSLFSIATTGPFHGERQLRRFHLVSRWASTCYSWSFVRILHFISCIGFFIVSISTYRCTSCSISSIISSSTPPALLVNTRIRLNMCSSTISHGTWEHLFLDRERICGRFWSGACWDIWRRMRLIRGLNFRLVFLEFCHLEPTPLTTPSITQRMWAATLLFSQFGTQYSTPMLITMKSMGREDKTKRRF